MSFLLKKTKELDNELDSLFKSAVKITQSVEKVNQKRRKVEEEGAEGPSTKRVKSSKASSSSKKAIEQPVEVATAAATKSKSKKVKKKAVEEDVDSEDEDVARVEEQYLAGRSERPTDGGKFAAAAGSDDDEGESGENKIPVHESLQEGAKRTRSSKSGLKKKFVPLDETPDQRDRRTVFVGNLPMSVAQNRPLQKQLQRHIVALVPTSKIESVRFRSVPFQAPTAKLDASAEGSGAIKNPAAHPNTKTPRQHDLERTSMWRLDNDEEAVKKDQKTYLTPNQKKRIAFINQEFHSTADSVNAYVVFAHPVDQSGRLDNLPPLPKTMDPYEAATLAVERCNGTLFSERLLRVDRVGKAAKPGAGEGDVETPVGALLDADPKLSIFVGNLDFASKEEDVRVFFESLLVSEKGAPFGEGDVKTGEAVVIEKPNTWVTHVRIVRDKDTQLGKGFAYVQFSDKDCVDQVLAMDSTRVKFAKRKLRVERCKSVPGTALKIKSQPAPKKGGSTHARQPRPAPVEVPKGDPLLGERLAHLSKEDRKEAKSKDSDRLARRLAKKKARHNMGSDVSGVREREERGRERKSGTGGGAKRQVLNPGKKTGNPRIKSDKAMAKRNFKKD